MDNKSPYHIFKVSPFVGLILLPDFPRFTIAAATDNYLKAYKKGSEILETGFFKAFENSQNDEQMESLSSLRSLLITTLTKGIPGKLEGFYFKLINDNGIPFEGTYVDVDIIPVFDETDLVISIIVSIKDTKNKTVSRNLLNKNNQDYRVIIENSLNAFFLTKSDGTILEANKAACDLFNYSVQEFIQIGLEGIIDLSGDRLLEQIEERNETGKLKAELVGIKKNGEKFLVEVSSVIFLDANGAERASTFINDITVQKSAENALLKSEHYLHEAQKLAKMGSWNFDFEADRLTWSDALYDVFGANKQTFLETHGSFVNLVANEDRALVLETSRRSQLTGQPFNIEYRITTPNGENRIIQESGFSEKNATGDIVRLFGTAQDITEQKGVEQALKLSEKKYKALFENNPMPMFIWDFKTLNIIDCNEEAVLKYGYTRQEFLQLNIRDIIPKEDIPLFNAATETETAYEQIHKKVWRHSKKNDELMQMEVTAHLMDYNGRRVSLLLLNDITEKIEAQNLLSESERLYKLLFYHSPLPKWIYDIETFKILDVNVTASAHYGYSRAEFLNMKIIDLQPSSEDPKLLLAHKDIKNDESIIRFGVFIHRKKNRDSIKVEVSGYLLLYNGTECILAACNDVTERENALQQLTDNEAKLITAQRIAKIGYWQMDVLKKSIFWSDEVYAIWGVSKDSFELSYDSFLKTIHPDDKDIFATKEKDSFIAEHEPQFQHRIILPDGSLKWIQVKGKLLTTLHDSPIFLEGTVQDITTEKILELSLQESNQRYNYVTKATSDAIWDWDLINDIFFWGEGFQILFGHGSHELSSEISSWTKNLHPDDLDRVVNGVHLIIDSSENTWSDEYRYLKGDGTYAIVIDKAFVLRNDKGKAIRMVGAIQDITQRKKEEQQLKLLESVVTNTNDAILITEAEPLEEPGPKIVYVNEAFTKMTGYAADEVIGKSPRILQGPKSDKQELARLSNALRNWESCEATIINYKKNGEEFWINFSISPVADERGWFTHWISIERDVTQRKHEEQQKLLLAEITMLFNQPKSFSETLNQVLQAIVATGNYCMAEAWMVGADRKNMNLLAKHVVGDKLQLLYAGNPDIRNLPIGEGLPAIVGETQTIQQWNLDEENEYFIRKNEAIKAGVKKIIGIPLLYNEIVIGSLLLGSNTFEKMRNDFILKSHNFSAHLGAEIKRKQLEQELNQVFDYSQDIICIADFNGYFKKINPVACELLGYTEEELLNRPYSDFIHPDDVTVTVKEIEILSKGQPTYYFENRYISKSGKIIWFAWSSTPSPEEKLIFAVAKDVTEKKNLEVLLNKSNRLAAIGSWEINVTTGAVYWSDITKEIREVDPDFVPDLSTGISYFKEGENKETISQRVKECIENGTSWDEELQIITQRGNLKWIRTIGEAEIANGRCIRVYGSVQDIDARKKAEIKLAESENRFRTILEAEPECVKLLGRNDEVLMMNPAGLAMIEADNEQQVVNESVLEFILPEHRTAFSDLTKDVFNGKSGNLVFEIKGLKGTRRWLETNAVPLKNEIGDITSLLGITRDITERKKAEEGIRDSEEKRRLIMGGALDAIICIDTDESITFWNPQAEAIFGWKEAEVMGQQLSKLIVPEQFRRYHIEGIKHFVETGIGKALNMLLELSGLRRSGEEFPIELTIIPVKQGGELFFCAFIRDITERKMAEENIRQSNERFEKATQATNDAIWDWDIVKDNLYRGNGFNTLFGYEITENTKAGEFWQDKLHAEDWPLVKESLQKIIEDPYATNWQQEYRIIKNNGKVATVIDRGIVIRNVTGEAVRMVGAMTDITYRKEYENSLKRLNETLEQHAQELAVSNKELEQFAYVASHDLQEPLRMVTSFLTQLEKKYGDTIDDKGKQYIYFAVDGAKRMRQIILDLLEFSRVGRLENPIEQVNVNELVSNVMLFYTNQIEESNAIIEVEKLPVISTHKTPLFQIFQNIIGNALKYRHNEKAPVIKIRCREIPGYWMFSIKDNGIGIDQEYFEKIFIIFQRLHNKDEYTGTGIGLAIVKKIINNLDGKIWVESEEGKGTVFYFTLPRK